MWLSQPGVFSTARRSGLEGVMARAPHWSSPCTHTFGDLSWALFDLLRLGVNLRTLIIVYALPPLPPRGPSPVRVSFYFFLFFFCNSLGTLSCVFDLWHGFKAARCIADPDAAGSKTLSRKRLCGRLVLAPGRGCSDHGGGADPATFAGPS